jgi:ATPase subunit of ABC transporter with duplicated ATPase domains
MITGQDKPDDGAIKIGDTVQLGYVDQSRDSLAPTRRSTRRSRAATRSSISATAR